MKFIAKIAAPGTCWWTPHARTGARIDYLFSITRVYSRKYRGYFYQFNSGRLRISVCFSR